MNHFIVFLNFIRVRQYYKNIIIFLPLVFSINLFSPTFFFITIFGFIALCLVSSAMYVRNDIIDVELDKLHPHKSKRALPSGAFTTKQAWFIFIALASAGFSLAFFLDWKAGVILFLLFLNTEIYSRWMKNIIFLDAFSIAGNFIIRTILGAVLINSILSPWLILGVFFVALFLGYTKRKGELESLEKAGEHRATLKEYTPFSLNSVVIISAMMIIATYSLYAIEGPRGDWRLVMTVPLVIFVIFRQLHLSSINPEIAQRNEILKDKQSTIAMIVFIGLTICLIYFVPSGFFSHNYHT